jgi:hypothetical protein
MMKFIGLMLPIYAHRSRHPPQVIAGFFVSWAFAWSRMNAATEPLQIHDDSASHMAMRVLK